MLHGLIDSFAQLRGMSTVVQEILARELELESGLTVKIISLLVVWMPLISIKPVLLRNSI